MIRDYVMWLFRCLWKGHTLKFATWPHCIYCGKDVTNPWSS